MANLKETRNGTEDLGEPIVTRAKFQDAVRRIANATPGPIKLLRSLRPEEPER